MGLRRIVPRVLLGAVVLVVAAGAWLIVRGVLAVGEAMALKTAAAQFEADLDVAASDAAGAASTLDRMSGDAGALAGHALTLASLTSDPVWRAAEAVPFAGEQLAAARVGAAELAHLTVAGRDVLRAAAGVLDAPAAGGLDLEAIRALRPPLDDVVAALDDARTALDGIDRTRLLGPVDQGLDALQAMIERTGPAFEAMRATAAVVPPLLGADEPRLILLMLQNPAELRAGGGITGTFIAIRADDGHLELVDQADGSVFAPASEPLLEIPADASASPDDGVGRFVQNITTTPDFALSARLGAAWWEGRTGQQADAVVALDPLVLKPLLALTGPVMVGERQIWAEQVVDALLRDPYLEQEQDAQTAFFRAVTESVFTAAIAKPAEAPGMAFHLAPMIDAGRLAVWSAHAEEQSVLKETPAAGLAARIAQRDAHALLFDDLTGGKLDAYLAADLGLTTSRCRPDGVATTVVRATLTSAVDPGMILPWTSFPAMGGFDRHDIGLRLTALAPPGSVVEAVQVDGKPVAWSAATVVGRPGAAARVTLTPGQSAVVEFRFAGDPDPSDPVLIHTPLVGDPPIRVEEGSCR